MAGSVRIGRIGRATRNHRNCLLGSLDTVLRRHLRLPPTTLDAASLVRLPFDDTAGIGQGWCADASSAALLLQGGVDLDGPLPCGIEARDEIQLFRIEMWRHGTGDT